MNRTTQEPVEQKIELPEPVARLEPNENVPQRVTVSNPDSRDSAFEIRLDQYECKPELQPYATRANYEIDDDVA